MMRALQAALDKRTATVLEALEQRGLRQVDRLFAVLMPAQWLFGIALSLWLSPWAWDGAVRTVHPHVWTAIFLGASITLPAMAVAIAMPGRLATRYIMAVAQMLTSALLIHLTGGRIETHFHVFGSLGFLAAYRDWPVLLTATVVVALEHLLRGLFWPESVYGIVNPEWWRFLEHAFWVAFSVSFLAVLCRRSVRDMRGMAEKGAELEALSESEWRRSSVIDRDAS